MSPKIIRQKKNLNYVKITRYSKKFQVSKCPYTLNLSILKALLSKY